MIKPNYRSVKKQKIKKEIDINKLEEIKKIIIEILLFNKIYWDKKNTSQQGLDINILLRKIKEKDLKVQTNIINLAIEELEIEQKIVKSIIENMTRIFYIKI